MNTEAMIFAARKSNRKWIGMDVTCDAIDKYKDRADSGAFQIKLDSHGYPPDLQTIVDGVDVQGKKVRFYTNQRGVFLAHIISPPARPGQTCDVFIYLIRHESEDLSDIRVAEFFLGAYWENIVFPAVLQRGFIGISTSAYGTFLCICRVIV